MWPEARPGKSLPEPYFEQDGCIIYCGNNLDIMPLIDRASLVITDPPYGVKYDDQDWDLEVPETKWLELAREIAPIVIFTPGNGSQYSYPKPKWTLGWFRPGSVQRASGGGFSHWEPLLVYGKNPMPFDAKQFDANTKEGGNGHPCAKPVSVFEWIIKNATKEKETVLDCFMGSGTALIAARKWKRKGIGIEINEKYCEIAAKRLEALQIFDFEPVSHPTAQDKLF